MRTCRKCGHLYDPGDLRNGVCDDCREKDEKSERATELMCGGMHGRFIPTKSSFGPSQSLPNGGVD